MAGCLYSAGQNVQAGVACMCITRGSNARVGVWRALVWKGDLMDDSSSLCVYRTRALARRKPLSAGCIIPSGGTLCVPCHATSAMKSNIWVETHPRRHLCDYLFYCVAIFISECIWPLFALLHLVFIAASASDKLVVCWLCVWFDLMHAPDLWAEQVQLPYDLAVCTHSDGLLLSRFACALNGLRAQILMAKCNGIKEVITSLSQWLNWMAEIKMILH